MDISGIRLLLFKGVLFDSGLVMFGNEIVDLFFGFNSVMLYYDGDDYSYNYRGL